MRSQRTLFKAQKQNNPHTITYLAKAWGVSKNFPLLNLKKWVALGLLSLNAMATKQKTKPTKLGIIDSLEAAKVHYSVKALFVANLVHEHTVEESVFAHEFITQAKHVHQFCEEAKGEWVVAEPNIVRNYSTIQAPSTDEIWHTAEQVWMDLGSKEIARGFIFAYHIAKRQRSLTAEAKTHSFRSRSFTPEFEKTSMIRRTACQRRPEA
jgi:hypothetical protein